MRNQIFWSSYDDQVEHPLPKSVLFAFRVTPSFTKEDYPISVRIYSIYQIRKMHY